MRGKGPTTRARRPRWRITPAYAGKSVSRRPRWTHTGDHPRVCGEKGEKGGRSHEQHGSPPRMRGKDFTWSFASVKLRITPACAGKRIKLRKRHSICGEKLADEYPDQAARGSPPRVRGKGRKNRIPFASPRITPAYAGKRIKLRKRHSICGDHPRACGEKVVSKRFRCTSPWITPARAGKSYTAFVRLHPLRDHPRACGEKDEVWQQLDELVGSPPRVRGKVPAVCHGP